MHLTNHTLEPTAREEMSHPRSLLSQPMALAPWEIAEAPWKKWALMADDAAARGDQPEAEQMIQFAYWSADCPGILSEDKT